MQFDRNTLLAAMFFEQKGAGQLSAKCVTAKADAVTRMLE
jgi:hypothetical protein